jgi:hypothetical protein
MNIVHSHSHAAEIVSTYFGTRAMAKAGANVDTITAIRDRCLKGLG